MTTFLNDEASLGIKEGALENLVLELNNDVDKIDFLLRQVEMLMYDTNDFFKGQNADHFRDKFETFRQSIETIKLNLLSYPNDLLKIRDSVKNFDSRVSNQFQEFSTDIRNEAKNIDN